MEFEEFRAEVTNKMRKSFLQIFEHMKGLLKAYFYVSLAATVLDLIEFLI